MGNMSNSERENYLNHVLISRGSFNGFTVLTKKSTGANPESSPSPYLEQAWTIKFTRYRYILLMYKQF